MIIFFFEFAQLHSFVQRRLFGSKYLHHCFFPSPCSGACVGRVAWWASTAMCAWANCCWASCTANVGPTDWRGPFTAAGSSSARGPGNLLGLITWPNWFTMGITGTWPTAWWWFCVWCCWGCRDCCCCWGVWNVCWFCWGAWNVCGFCWGWNTAGCCWKGCWPLLIDLPWFEAGRLRVWWRWRIAALIGSSGRKGFRAGGGGCAGVVVVVGGGGGWWTNDTLWCGEAYWKKKVYLLVLVWIYETISIIGNSRRFTK